MRPIARTRPVRRLVAALATTGVAGTLALAPVSPPSASAATTCNPTTAKGWQAAVTSGQKALAGAVTALQNHNYDAATTQLRTMRRQVRIAHTGATALIGKPPTDPESDDPPGPPAVLRVSGFEHKITVKLVPLFDHVPGGAVPPLGPALNVADICRDVMLGKVLALGAAKLDDYTDGLTDTLPDYKPELTAFSTALSKADLSTEGRSSLKQAQQVVKHTSAAMQKQFGGGERPAR